jgi:hypothetical protein
MVGGGLPSMRNFYNAEAEFSCLHPFQGLLEAVLHSLSLFFSFCSSHWGPWHPVPIVRDSSCTRFTPCLDSALTFLPYLILIPQFILLKLWLQLYNSFQQTIDLLESSLILRITKSTVTIDKNMSVGA